MQGDTLQKYIVHCPVIQLMLNYNWNIMKKTSTIYHQQPTKFAFTIVELLVVIVVIGILAAITIVSYTGISSKTTVSSLQSDLSSAKKQLNLYYIDNSVYPTSLNASNCPINASSIVDTRYCLKPSPNTIYSYAPNNNQIPTGFSLTATSNSTSYKVTDSTAPTIGDNSTYGLVLNLDAGNSASYPGSGTTLTDLSGMGNNGTLVNGVGYTSANGGALSFDGVNDYVTLPDLSVVEDKDFTYEAWVTASLGISTDIMVAIGEGNSLNANTISFLAVGVANGYENTISYRMRSDDAVSDKSVTASPPNILNGNPHYIVASVNGSTISLYADGIFYNSTTVSAGAVTVDRARVGARPRSSMLEKYWAKDILIARIYNRALTPNEITNNFNATKSRYGL